YLVLVAGYWRIAIRVLGGPGSLTVPRDSILVSVAILIWTAVASTAKALVGLPMAVILAAILGALGLGIAMTRKEFRCDYAPRRLLNLE
ncbi:hypothetical protein, partial [Pseudomonas sp. FW306-2-11AD]|uniref:hypothetical protein n=1 Tax=Pseudomonas sp. FW306-2-11AD TaxID=2070665 RepID=UPI000CC8C21C